MGQIGWLMGIITPAFPAMKGGRKKLEGAALERSVVVPWCGRCGELLAGGGEEEKREMHCCRFYLCCQPENKKTMHVICLRFCFLIPEIF